MKLAHNTDGGRAGYLALILLGAMAAAIECGAAADVQPIYDGIRRHKDLKSDIAQKEKVMNSLKPGRGGSDMWNFAERRRRERLIQERSKLMVEIGRLSSESDAQRDRLLDSFKEFSSGLATGLKDTGYVAAYVYLEQLMAERLMSGPEIMSEARILAATRSNKQAFLAERYQSQQKNLKGLNEALERLNRARDLISGAGLADYRPELDKIRERYRDRIAAINNSNEILSRSIKQ